MENREDLLMTALRAGCDALAASAATIYSLFSLAQLAAANVMRSCCWGRV